MIFLVAAEIADCFYRIIGGLLFSLPMISGGNTEMLKS